MLTKRLAVVIVATVLLMFFGCRKEQSDNRLVQIAVKLEKQEAKVDRVARKVEGIEARLNEIQGSLREIGRPSKGAEPSGTVERQAVDFRETPQYEKMAAALSAIQQRLNLTENGLAEAKDEAGRARKMARRSMASGELADRLDGIEDPEEMGRRLDALAETFGQKIEDPILRQRFQADVDELKQSKPEELTTDEVYQLFVSDLTQRLNSEQDPARRRWIEAQLAGLESLPPEELEGLRQGWERTENFRRLWNLAERYHIPPGTLRDIGLPAMSVYFEFRDGEVLCGFRQEPYSEPAPGEVRTRYEAKNPPKAQ